MRRRILAVILGVATLAVVLFGAPLMVVVGRMLDESAVLNLERQAILASRSIPADLGGGTDPVEFEGTAEGVTFGLYDQAGTLISGSGPALADAVTNQALANEVVDTEVGEARVVAVPLSFDEEVVGAVRAEQSTVAGDARATRIFGFIVALGLLVLIIGGIVGWIVTGRLVRPVIRLRDAAVDLGDGDFSIEVPASDIVEIDQVGRAMNATASRLNDLVSRERHFSGNVSHQLRTPLAGLRTAIETELAFPRPDPQEVLREAVVDLDRIERTVNELLSLARTPTVANSRLSVGSVLSEIESNWSGEFARLGRSLEVATGRFLPEVVGTSVTLRHALDVLIDNGLRHGEGAVHIGHAVGDDSVTLQVTDEGAGFSSSPSDPAGSSSGLGLPLAKRLVESMPGRLTISRSGGHPQVDVVLQRVRLGPDAAEVDS